MNQSSPPENLEQEVFHSFPPHGDRKPIWPMGPLDRLVASTASVNALLWAGTLFVIWWAGVR